MLEFVKNELKKHNIDLISSISLEDCNIKRKYLLEKAGISTGTAILFAVPYLTKTSAGERNISSYAVSRDYHFFFKSLFEAVIPLLQKAYPNYKFAGFTDHSPIDEIGACAKSGLGVIGKNHLLITEKYSSYVFIGEIITDAILPSQSMPIKGCIGCNKCKSACPIGLDPMLCLSSLTQKKGELSKEEEKAIRNNGFIWGCDKCQEVCPHTKKAFENNTIYSPIPFFNQDLTPTLSLETLDQMSDEEFSLRAYSWRGRKTIERNIKIFEKGGN